MIMLAFIFCLWLPNDNAGFYFLFKGSNIHDTFLQVRAGSGNRDYHYTHWTILIELLKRICQICQKDLNMYQ